ncbi:MAG: hypothetical protein JWM27_4742 [Gemmatimonadetes bacterium]|nr:hypothetical protein [Gemmatimonadota bacterium]
MAPHRAVLHPPLATSALTAETGAVLVAMMSIVTGLHVVAFGLLLITMTADVVLGTRRAQANARERYHVDTAAEGMTRKLRRLMLVVVGFTMDGMGIVISHFLAQVTGAEELPTWARLAGLGWATAMAIAWLWYLEILSIRDNLQRTEGERILFPGFLMASRMMDAIAYREQHGAELPVRRHGDVAVADAVEESPP